MATFVVLRRMNNILASMGDGIETFIDLKPETKLRGPNSIDDKGDCKGYLAEVTIDGINYKDIKLCLDWFKDEDGDGPSLRKLSVGGRRKSRRKTRRRRRYSRRR
jgi:hypothetical protein